MMVEGKKRTAGMPWFRCHFVDWDSDEIRSLDFATIGFLHLLRMRIIERGEPFPVAFLARLGREHGVARKTIDKLLATLAEHGLIVVIEAGIWCEDLADEIEFREARSEKISERNRKTSKRRWEKVQKNQSNAMPNREVDIEGRPSAAPFENYQEEASCRPLSANAERPPADKDAEDRIHEGPNHRNGDDRQDYEEGDDIEIAGIGECLVERVQPDGLIVRSASTGEYLELDIKPDGFIDGWSARMFDDPTAFDDGDALDWSEENEEWRAAQ